MPSCVNPVMAGSAIETAVRTGRLTRALIYAALLVFAVYYLLPLFVMMVNSFKELDEIRGGNMPPRISSSSLKEFTIITKSGSR